MTEQATETTGTTTGTEAATDATTGDSTATDTTATESTATEGATSEGEAALGEPGKKALDAMKAKWKAAEEKAKTEAAEKAALQAKIDGTEAEHAKAAEEQRIKDEALAAANLRILKADIRTVAKGKLTDPNDAFRYPEDIDLSAFEADADGEYDHDAIAQAIDGLITKKPYLAAQGGSRFEGPADGGPRNGDATSIDTQIADAQKAGEIETVIALKQQKAAEASKSK